LNNREWIKPNEEETSWNFFFVETTVGIGGSFPGGKAAGA